MRVIAGTAKGHKLVAPKTDATRPALDRVKESIFDILFDVTDSKVLDLFAGSGSIGIEALSRGSVHCVFVEHGKLAVASIHKNLHRCHLTEKATVLAMKVNAAVKKLEHNKGFLGKLFHKNEFDLIFVDPPYEQNLVNPTLELLGTTSLLHDKTLMIVEHHPKEPLKELAALVLTDERRYGQTHVSFLKRKS
ncbi:MAG: 16S rRNA (guanine(966)-N(2))-methyltransferase RsmD [Deltaproteobacteria bacterium RIFCSPLOWO2_02_FULL_44_10]|nr:MAG: 16S rRNA (guanine(966)-N(2))-methyltransferase RsmD [Deltaproteobacteria bacterium RIFCSPHIGHO2_02_FULL_44_16]OGQ46739.1 MAG: 16S rRNA (guanine(966)-N(2))-methyltransferase RsmD [Deltaproteobacteria bacterium RIFCSPLOWO2_02_FULL_44_10]